MGTPDENELPARTGNEIVQRLAEVYQIIALHPETLDRLGQSASSEVKLLILLLHERVIRAAAPSQSITQGQPTVSPDILPIFSALRKPITLTSFICDESGKPKRAEDLTSGQGSETSKNTRVINFLQERAFRACLGDLVTITTFEKNSFAASALTQKAFPFLKGLGGFVEAAIQNTIAYYFHSSRALTAEEVQAILDFKVARASERMQAIYNKIQRRTKDYQDVKQAEVIIEEILTLDPTYQISQQLQQQLNFIRNLTK